MRKMIVLACLTVAASFGAHATVSGQVGFVSDYRFRGISQTDENFAVQGGMEYAPGAGLYVGTWASSVDFDDGDEASTELDVYLGYGRSLGEHWSWGVTAFHYAYPGAADSLDYDYSELMPRLSYSPEWGEAGLGVAYSPDFFAASGDALYYDAALSLALPRDMSLGLHAGYQSIEKNGRFGTPDYMDWSLSIGIGLAGLDWSLSYIDTDLDRDECFGGADLCGGTAVLSVTRGF